MADCATSSGDHAAAAAPSGRTAPSAAHTGAAAARPHHLEGGRHQAKRGMVQTQVPICRSAQLEVRATPVDRPLNHLLINARNISGARCDLGIIGRAAFDGIAAGTPDGLGGGPHILAPGGSHHEGVALDRQDAPGQGTHTGTLTVRLNSNTAIKVPLKTFVHAPAVTTPWEPTAADALSR
ncbi:hypothetical protein ACIHFE_00065 [Streptomyces sp. NPDC052396]|uniref:hypothetical protein n=1 Tax=Streptomyces sp. NPDC052396 TaxID=3365689 RepID=UPI0037D1F4B2